MPVTRYCNALNLGFRTVFTMKKHPIHQSAGSSTNTLRGSTPKKKTERVCYHSGEKEAGLREPYTNSGQFGFINLFIFDSVCKCLVDFIGS